MAYQYRQALIGAGAECRLEKISAPTTTSQQLHVVIPKDEQQILSKASLQRDGLLHCPKCGQTQKNEDECAACGIVFAKYIQQHNQQINALSQPSLQKSKEKIPAAGFAPRFWSLFVDTCIIALVSAALIYAAEHFSLSETWLRYLPIAVCISYFFYFWTYHFATPGMFLAGIELVDGQTLEGAGENRYIIRLLLTLSVIPVVISAIWLLKGAKQQTLHDKLANTIVIRKTDKRALRHFEH